MRSVARNAVWWKILVKVLYVPKWNSVFCYFFFFFFLLLLLYIYINAAPTFLSNFFIINFGCVPKCWIHFDKVSFFNYRFDNILGRETIHTLEYLTSKITSIFSHPTMVDRIASMLNYFLYHLVGPKKKNFKVS